MTQERDRRLRWASGLALAGLGVLGFGILGYFLSGALSLHFYEFLVVSLVLIIAAGVVGIDVVRQFGRKRAVRLGTSTVVIIGMAIFIVGFVNWITYQNMIRWDVTRDNYYSISPQTESVLQNLQADVAILCFFKTDSRDQVELEEFLDSYRGFSKRVSYEFIDPDRDPQRMRSEAAEYNTIIIRSGRNETRITDLSEEAITNAIIRVSRGRSLMVYFLQGHGEWSPDDAGDGYLRAKEALVQQGFDVKPLILLENPFPTTLDVLVIAGPRGRFLDGELTQIDNYIENGGRVLFLLDPDSRSQLGEHLGRYGMRSGDRFIVDQNLIAQVIGDPLMVVVSEFQEHAITRAFTKSSRLPAILKFARPLELKDTEDGYRPRPLFRTSPESFALPLSRIQGSQIVIDPEQDEKASFVIGAAVVKKGRPSETTEDAAKEEGMSSEGAEARLVVVGNSRFAHNQNLDAGGNRDLFMNMVSWLAEQEDLISIRAKIRGTDPLYLTKQMGHQLFFWSVIAVPTVVMGLGILIWARRRRR